MIAHDLDKDGQLNWPEAEKYRLGVRELILARFDKNKDRKLTGEERVAANAMLARGIPSPRRHLKRYGPSRHGITVIWPVETPPPVNRITGNQ